MAKFVADESDELWGGELFRIRTIDGHHAGRPEGVFAMTERGSPVRPCDVNWCVRERKQGVGIRGGILPIPVKEDKMKFWQKVICSEVRFARAASTLASAPSHSKKHREVASSEWLEWWIAGKRVATARDSEAVKTGSPPPNPCPSP